MPSVYVHNLLLLLLVVSSFAVYNGVSAAGGYQPLQATGEHVEVLTKQGRLRGLVVDVTRDTRVGGNGGPTGKRVNAFLGVHYARPPGRFEKPQPPEPWTGVRNATEMAPGCHTFLASVEVLMSDLDVASGGPPLKYSEDCLWIDIYTPANLASTEKKARGKPLLPVLVYIHGGGFNEGTVNVYGKQDMVNLFAARGIVFIQLEYRMGMFGFAAGGDADFNGNFGLWDQTQALRWIKENIRAFGGNPDLVTVAGNSAGGASTSALSVSTHSRGLFHQAMPISGSIFNGWALSRDWVVDATRRVATKLGCPTGDSKAMKHCLQSKTVAQIQNATNEEGPSKNARPDVYVLRFVPHNDGDFFVKDPAHLLETAPKQPTLIGFNELEMGIYGLHNYEDIVHLAIPKEKWATFGRQDFANYVRQYIALPSHYGKHSPAVQEAIINHYSNHTQKSYAVEWDGQPGYWMKQTLDVVGHLMFFQMEKAEARIKAHLGWPVYFYMISYWNRCYTNNSMLPVRGAQHAIEQPYLFNFWVYPVTTPFPVTNYSAGDIAFQELGVNTIVQFVKSGNPSLHDSLQPWPRVKSNGPLDFVRLDTVPVVEKGLWEEEDAFWTTLHYRFPQFDIMRGNGAPWANNALVLDEAGGGKKAKGTPFKPPQAPTGQLQQEE